MVIFASTEDAAINAMLQMRGIIGDVLTGVEIVPKDIKLYIAKHSAKARRRGIVKFRGITDCVIWIKHPLVSQVTEWDGKCVGYSLSDGETWIVFLDRKAVSFDEECG